MPLNHVFNSHENTAADATLVALNAKYVHTSLSIRSIAAYCNDFNVKILDLTINDHFENLLEQIYQNRSKFIGFSCYIWNLDLCLKLANALKLMDHSLVIIFGGPEVSFDSVEILNEHPYIDGIIAGEGEFSWRTLLCNVQDNTQDYSMLPSFYYRDPKSRKILHNGSSPPLALDDIPFAYDWDNLPSAPQLIYYESSRGCPFNCGFCLSANTAVRYLSIDRTIFELTQLANAGVRQIKLVDRTFNASKARALAIWRALIQLDTSIKTNFHFEINASLLDDDCIDLLLQAPPGRFQFEIGVQSTNIATLDAVKRSHDFSRIADVVAKLKAGGNIHIHLDLIAGLPKEDMQRFKQSFDQVFALRPNMFQLGFLKLLKGSDLRAQAEKFGLVFGDFPPYRVLKTPWLSPDELMLLQKCEYAVDRFYHAQSTITSIEYLLQKTDSAFELFVALTQYTQGSSKPLQTIHSLWAYAQKQGLADTALKNLLIYDWLTHEKRGILPFGKEVSPEINKKIRAFYRNDAPALLGLDAASSSNAWRYCHVHIFDIDVLKLIETEREIKEEIKEETAVFFDYIKHRTYKINLNKLF